MSKQAEDPRSLLGELSPDGDVCQLGGGEPKFQEERERNLLVVMEAAQSTVSVSPREPPGSMDSTEMGKYQVTNVG